MEEGYGRDTRGYERGTKGVWKRDTRGVTLTLEEGYERGMEGYRGYGTGTVPGYRRGTVWLWRAGYGRDTREYERGTKGIWKRDMRGIILTL